MIMSYSDVVLIEYEIFNSSLRYNPAPSVPCNQLSAGNKDTSHPVSAHSNLKNAIAGLSAIVLKNCKTI